MTIEDVPLPLHELPGYRGQLLRDLEVAYARVRFLAIGSLENEPYEFDAALTTLAHLASELRWLALGQDELPF